MIPFEPYRFLGHWHVLMVLDGKFHHVRAFTRDRVIAKAMVLWNESASR